MVVPRAGSTAASGQGSGSPRAGGGGSTTRFPASLVASSLSFPQEWGDAGAGGADPKDHAWWSELRLVPVATASLEAVWATSSLCRRAGPPPRLVSLRRVQCRRLWQDFARYRDEVVGPSSLHGDPNERLLFHGTGAEPAESVLMHPHGLDPRFASDGGFYGRGVYLAEEPGYTIGGRYAHRLPGHDGRRVQLLIVRAAIGTPQEMGLRVNADTRAMTMPGVRVEGPPRALYGCVRAGPHRPQAKGPGPMGIGDPNASVIYVMYEARQMYPAYVAELELPDVAEACLVPVALTPTTSAPALQPRQVEGSTGSTPQPPMPSGAAATAASAAAGASPAAATPPAAPAPAGGGAGSAVGSSGGAARPAAQRGAGGGGGSGCKEQHPGHITDSSGARRKTMASRTGHIEGISSARGKVFTRAASLPRLPKADSQGSPMLATRTSPRHVHSPRRGSSPGDGAPADAADRATAAEWPPPSAPVSPAASARMTRKPSSAAAPTTASGANVTVATPIGVIDGSQRGISYSMLVALAAKNPSSRARAAGALQALAGDPAKLQSIVASGALPHLAELLQDGGGTRGRDCSAGAIRLLCQSGSAEIRSAVAAAGAIPGLVAVLRQQSANRARIDAAISLAALAATSTDIARSIGAAGGVPELAAQFREDSPAGREAAAQALATLVDLLELNVQIVAEQGVVKRFLCMLTDQDASGQDQRVSMALKAIGHFAMSSLGRKALVEAGAPAALVAVLRSPVSSASDERATAAAGALSHLASGAESRAAVADAGATTALTELLGSGCPSAQAAAASALSELNSVGRDHWAEAEAEEVVKSLLLLLKKPGKEQEKAARDLKECLLKKGPLGKYAVVGLADLVAGADREVRRLAASVLGEAMSGAPAKQVLSPSSPMPEAGFVDSLVQAVERAETEVEKVNAVGVLASFVSSGGDTARQMAAHAGALQVLARMASIGGGGRAAAAAFSALDRVASFSDPAAAAEAPCLAEAAAVMLRSGGDSERSRAMSLLEKATPLNEHLCLALVGAGAIQPLVAILEGKGEPQARASASTILDHLAESPGVRSAAERALSTVMQEGDAESRALAVRVLDRLSPRRRPAGAGAEAPAAPAEAVPPPAPRAVSSPVLGAGGGYHEADAWQQQPPPMVRRHPSLPEHTDWPATAMPQGLHTIGHAPASGHSSPLAGLRPAPPPPGAQTLTPRSPYGPPAQSPYLMPRMSAPPQSPWPEVARQPAAPGGWMPGGGSSFMGWLYS